MTMWSEASILSGWMTMEAEGFEKLTPGAYYDANHGLLLYDLFPKNTMQAADGVIYPFDPVIQRIQTGSRSVAI